MDEKGKAMVGCAGLTLRRTARRAREALGTWDPPPAQTQAGLGPGRALSRSSRRVPGGVVDASTAFRALVRRCHLGRRIRAHPGRIASE